jgi:hypothetical protein
MDIPLLKRFLVVLTIQLICTFEELSAQLIRRSRRRRRMDNSTAFICVCTVVIGQGFAIKKFDEEAFVDVVRN